MRVVCICMCVLIPIPNTMFGDRFHLRFNDCAPGRCMNMCQGYYLMCAFPRFLSIFFFCVCGKFLVRVRFLSFSISVFPWGDRCFDLSSFSFRWLLFCRVCIGEKKGSDLLGTRFSDVIRWKNKVLLGFYSVKLNFLKSIVFRFLKIPREILFENSEG